MENETIIKYLKIILIILVINIILSPFYLWLYYNTPTSYNNNLNLLNSNEFEKEFSKIDYRENIFICRDFVKTYLNKYPDSKIVFTKTHVYSYRTITEQNQTIYIIQDNNSFTYMKEFHTNDLVIDNTILSFYKNIIPFLLK